MRKNGTLKELGVKYSKNDTALESKIAVIIGKPGAQCNEVWSEVKKWLEDPNKKQKLAEKLSTNGSHFPQN